MAFPTTIPITTAPFQKGFVIGSTGFVTTNCAANMQFVNDGYTFLYVGNASGDDLTIDVLEVPDNAGRSVNTSFELIVTAGNTAILGPFKPIWWNQAGVVNVSFTADALTDMSVLAVSFQN